MTKQKDGAGSGTPEPTSQGSLLGPDMSNPNAFFSDLAGGKPGAGTREEGDEADQEQEPIEKGSLAGAKPKIPDADAGGDEGGGEGDEGEAKGKDKAATPRWSSLEEAEQSQREADRKIATQAEKTKQLEQELSTLKNLVGDTSIAERKIQELRALELRLKPFVGMDKAVTSIDDTLKNIHVPEEMMTGVDDAGNKIATEQDKMLAFVTDKRNLIKLVSDLSQASLQSEQAQKTEVAKAVDATLFNLCKAYNKAEGEDEGKPLTQTELGQLAQVMGTDNFNAVFDPATTERERQSILKGALLEYLVVRGKASAGDGGEDVERQRKKAALPRGVSDPKIPAGQINPQQKKVVDILSGMAAQVGKMRVQLPCDQPKQ